MGDQIPIGTGTREREWECCEKKKIANIARPYLAEAALAQHGEEVEVVHVVLPEARYHGGGCGQLARLLELGVRVGRLCCGTSQTKRVGWWV